MHEIQQFIWKHFAVKRRQFYSAGFLIGAFGGLIGAMHYAEHGFSLWAIPAGGALGVGAVWLLSFAERLQARAEGNPAGAQQALFVVLLLIALLAVALLVAGVCASFLSR